TVSVKWQIGIFTLKKFDKIKSISNTNGWSVISIAPGNPISVFDKNHTRIILISRFNHFGITGFHLDRFMINVPIDSIFAKTNKNIHLNRFVIASKNTGKAISKRNNRTIKNTVR